MKRTKKKEWVSFRDELQKAIKLNCYDCVGGQKKTDCELDKCFLFNYRPWAKNDQWPKS